MKTGRPLKFQSVDELQFTPNGLIEITFESFNTKDFMSETLATNHLNDSLDLLIESLYNDKIVCVSREMPLQKQYKLSPRGRRIDIFIQGQKNNYIIEVKNEKNTSEIRSSIGQLLDYGRELSHKDPVLILVSTMFDINTAKTIEYYKLPIKYIFMDKRKFLELKEIL